MWAVANTVCALACFDHLLHEATQAYHQMYSNPFADLPLTPPATCTLYSALQMRDKADSALSALQRRLGGGDGSAGASPVGSVPWEEELYDAEAEASLEAGLAASGATGEIFAARGLTGGARAASGETFAASEAGGMALAAGEANGGPLAADGLGVEVLAASGAAAGVCEETRSEEQRDAERSDASWPGGNAHMPGASPGSSTGYDGGGRGLCGRGGVPAAHAVHAPSGGGGTTAAAAAAVRYMRTTDSTASGSVSLLALPVAADGCGTHGTADECGARGTADDCGVCGAADAEGGAAACGSSSGGAATPLSTPRSRRLRGGRRRTAAEARASVGAEAADTDHGALDQGVSAHGRRRGWWQKKGRVEWWGSIRTRGG